MGAADPIFKTPTQAPAAPVASPAPLAPYDPDPYYGTNTKTPAATPAPVATPAPAVAPTAPQQPYVNPFMQTYGQNRTPQQQMFNRFPQSFQQPQPQSVAQPAQGPVYADQSLNAPGNQPQQYSGQPQYGRFGRGFMPQNRFGYDRQLDQLRGGYNRPMPPMMQGGQQMPYSSSMDAGMGDPRGYGNGMPYSSPASVRPGMGYGGDYGRFNMDRGQQQSPEEYARQRGYQYDPAPSAAPAAGQTQIPAYAQPYATSLANQPNTPAGGKGGNPTAQLPPPPNQDGTPGSWSTYT